jgi:hypothetical protein
MNDAPDRDIAVFTEAIRLLPTERDDYLTHACAGDSELRHRVEALLQAHEDAGDFLGLPAEGVPLRDVPEPEGGKNLGERIGHYKYGLSLDLKRSLSNEPVSAGPPSRLYKLRKTIQRNKLLFVAIGIIATLLLVTLVSLLVSLANERKARVAYEQSTLRHEGSYMNGSVNDNILNYFNAHGGKAKIGSAYDNGGTAYVHTWSGGGFSATVQDFAGGLNGTLNLQTSSFGTYQINDVHGLWKFYLAHGGFDRFGAATDDEHAYGGGTRQDFQAHYLTWDPRSGIVEH